MRRRHSRRSKGIRRRRSLKSTNAGPILALTGVILAVLACIALITFVAVPYILPVLGIEARLPWQPTPTPAPTPAPTPTPNPIKQINPVDLQTEIVLRGESSLYAWYADPYAYQDTLYFVGGHSVNGDVKMDALFALDMKSGEYKRVEATLSNASYVFPAANDAWLVYFDSKENGGGYIRAKNFSTGVEKIVKEVYAGQPRMHIDGDYLAWMERTGSRMDKLFVCDLNTLENVTVRTFNATAYGQSEISLYKGELIYAFEGTEDTEDSAIYRHDILKGGSPETYQAQSYVHDPITNGKQWVFRSGLHADTDALYWTNGSAPAKKIVEGVVSYGLSDTFAAYSKDESIYIYIFKDEESIQITPAMERTQLLGVSGGTVIWMDVTSRDSEVMKYARIE